jgi:hypothetical protein
MHFHKKVNSVLILPQLDLCKKIDRQKFQEKIKKIEKTPEKDLILLKLISRDHYKRKKSLQDVSSNESKLKLKRFMSFVQNVGNLHENSHTKEGIKFGEKFTQQLQSQPYFVKRLKKRKIRTVRRSNTNPELLISRKKITTVITSRN